MMAPDGRKGFTLVEIISVLVILGILAAVAIPKYYDLQERARIQSALVAVQEAQARINLLFAQQILTGNLNDCEKFYVTTLHSQSNLGSKYNYSITDKNDGQQNSGTVGAWRLFLTTGFSNNKRTRKDSVNVLIPPQGDWYVLNGESNAEANSDVQGKTKYTVPKDLTGLFVLSLPACE